MSFEAYSTFAKYPPPAILHSDQGSEYLSYKHRNLCDSLEIQLSFSAAGKPWQNGFMERWFGGFKLELGSFTKFDNLDKFHEGIAMQVYYYNHQSIHTALRMSPAAYAAGLMMATPRTPKSLDRVLCRKAEVDTIKKALLGGLGLRFREE